MKDKGFTLMELIIVIAIMAIIMLISVPAFVAISERVKIRSDRASANEIGKMICIREVDVGTEKQIKYYPIITRYDKVEGIENYISTTHRPQSMKDGYYFVTAVLVDGYKRILVGIGKKEMPITNTVYNSPKASGWVYIQSGEISEFLSENSGLLNEEVEMPEDYVTEAGVDRGGGSLGDEAGLGGSKSIDLKIGQFVNYRPTPGDFSEYSSVFLAGETPKWRIFSLSGSGIVLISEKSVGDVTLEGKSGYDNCESILNEIASKYANSEYALSGRSINGGDTTTVLSDTLHIGTNIWLASKEEMTSGENKYFSISYLSGSNKAKETYILYMSRSGGMVESLGAQTLGIRPLIYLKPGVKIISGDGTKENQYVLSE